MSNPIEKVFVSELVKMASKKSGKNQASYPQTRIPGIKIDRDRPAGTGWCGAENCGHATHRHYNEPAKRIET